MRALWVEQIERVFPRLAVIIDRRLNHLFVKKHLVRSQWIGEAVYAYGGPEPFIVNLISYSFSVKNCMMKTMRRSPRCLATASPVIFKDATNLLLLSSLLTCLEDIMCIFTISFCMP